uniref:Uncharacterized protein n=1 Tax=Arundo donax TaxID=35708 RepID=A0A0A9FMJ7_ARUDO
MKLFFSTFWYCSKFSSICLVLPIILIICHEISVFSLSLINHMHSF